MSDTVGLLPVVFSCTARKKKWGKEIKIYRKLPCFPFVTPRICFSEYLIVRRR
jgi:hypothetical protein